MRKNIPFTKISFFFIFVITSFILSSCSLKDTKSTNESNNQESNSTEQSNDVSNYNEQSNDASNYNEQIPNWKYFREKDDLTGETTSITAECFSKTSVNGSRIIIALYYGVIADKLLTTMYIQAEKGLSFARFQGSGMRVLFDTDEVIDDSWTLIQHTTDYSALYTNSIVNSENLVEKFVNKLKQSKKCKIQVNLENIGKKTFEFDVEGLNWPYEN